MTGSSPINGGNLFSTQSFMTERHPRTMKIASIILLPLDACLREAASAKAGGRIEVAAGSESLPPGHEPFRGGAWLGEGWTKWLSFTLPLIPSRRGRG